MSRVILMCGRLFAVTVVLLVPVLHYKGVTHEEAQRWAQQQGDKLAHSWIDYR